MIRAKEKPGARANEQTGLDTTGHCKKNYTRRLDKRLGAKLLASLNSRAWVITYSLEEARQRYADRRQLLRQAAVCLLLALVRLVGVRFV